MRKIIGSFLLIAACFQLNAQSAKKTVVHHPTTGATKVVVAQKAELHDFKDSLSYALGLSMAKYYKHQGLKGLNIGALNEAVRTVFNGDSAVISDDELGSFLMSADSKLASEKAAGAKKLGEEFLLKNKTKPGVISLSDGLQYQILQKGSGVIPVDSNSVKVNYSGALLDGTEFDNSYKRGEPLDIEVTGVIKGWTEILKLMPVGSKWRIWVPSDLAYGDRGAGETITPGSTLTFDIELLKINN